ncbi:MAG: hypothetical protein R3B48_03735 [Kofleriaceae bacterium]
MLRNVFLVVVALGVWAACGAGKITNLRLEWRGERPNLRPQPEVAMAFSAVPLAIFLHDEREAPDVVGAYDNGGSVVRTTDNVGQHCANHVAGLLVNAGARVEDAATVALDASLLEYHVLEGERFNATVKVRFSLRLATGNVLWSAQYVGTGSRWGRTHNPENYNEALTDGLTDVVTQLVNDHLFGAALVASSSVPQEPSAPTTPEASAFAPAPPASSTGS